MRFPTLFSAANAALLLDYSLHTQITVSFIFLLSWTTVSFYFHYSLTLDGCNHA